MSNFIKELEEMFLDKLEDKLALCEDCAHAYDCGEFGLVCWPIIKATFRDATDRKECDV